MNVIDGIFLFYIFIGLYMMSLFLFIYFYARKTLFSYPSGEIVPVSIVVPCYNEGKNIGRTIESLVSLDYPKDKIEVIVVDDRSKDDSVEIIKKYTKKYSNVRLIVNSRNSGGAAEPTNLGIKAAKYDFIAVADADSTPDRDALKKMTGFIQKDSKVAAVTCSVLAREPRTFMQKLQAIEYAMIAFNRKLLDSVDSVYVTPGPFALYRKKALIEVGLFDTKNLTQDIEIVWRLLSHGYKARMCLAARVYSATPAGFKAWWKQRVRWNIGGTQTLIKYRKTWFNGNMLGFFIVPFFSASLFIGLFGLGLFVYLFTRRMITLYLSTQYSIAANATLVHLQDLSFSPSILNFFGVILFIIGFIWIMFSLVVMREQGARHTNIFNTLFYSLVYLTVYPLIMIDSLYRLIRGSYSW